MKKLILSLFLSALFVSPSISFAADSYEIDFISGASTTPHTVIYEGLVPCGNKVCDLGELITDENILKQTISNFETARKTKDFKGACTDGTVNGKEHPDEENKICSCQFCHFFSMFKGLINFTLFKIIFPIAGLMIVLSGIMFFTAGGDPGKLSNAMKAIKATIIGLVIILAAWIIVNTFFLALGVTTIGGLSGKVLVTGTVAGNTPATAAGFIPAPPLPASPNYIGKTVKVHTASETIIRTINSRFLGGIGVDKAWGVALEAGNSYEIVEPTNWLTINCPIKYEE